MSDTSHPEDSSPTADEYDVLLMRRVCEGDMEAFEELVNIHKVRIVGTVAKMLHDDTDAEDLAQQVFVRIWKSAPRYKTTAKFTTWMFTITRNLVFNEMRRRKRHPSTSIEKEESDRSFQAEDIAATTPAQDLLEREMQDAIQSAIDALPEAQRLAIVMRRYENLPYEEIATVLGLTVPAVKSALFRARVTLREHLRSYLED